MKLADLKYQSVSPANPSPNTLALYADSGTAGVVYVMTSGGLPVQIGIRYTGLVANVGIATGQGVLDTGFFFGSTGVGTQRVTGLSSPYKWLNVIDSAGTNLAIPAYLLAP